MEVKVKETRGAVQKYDFAKMRVGEIRSFKGPKTTTLLNCAKRYSLVNNLGWRFRCYTDNGESVIVRVK